MTSDRNQLRWLPALRDLSDEQREIVNRTYQRSFLVYGPAGSGKTAMTIYAARNMQSLGQSIRVFVFTNALLRFIKEAVPPLEMVEEVNTYSGVPLALFQSVHSFYKWVSDVHKTCKICAGPRNQEGGDKFNMWVDHVIDYFSNNPSHVPHFDCIIVDEAQDFKPNVAKLIFKLTDRVFIAGDTAQSLYTDFDSIRQVGARWNIPQSGDSKQLVMNYRNPLEVAEVAAHFLTTSDLTMEEFTSRIHQRGPSSRPRWYEVLDDEQQSKTIKHIVDDVRGRDRIGILFRARDQVLKEAERLVAHGLKPQVVLPNPNMREREIINRLGVPWELADHNGGSASQAVIFGDPEKPILTTVHSAKGLEFEHVILAGLNSDWDNNWGDDRRNKRLLFVGMTRTKNQLYLISRKGHTSRYLLRLNPKLIQGPLPLPGQVPPVEDDRLDDIPF